jgi:hypothetical protein
MNPVRPTARRNRTASLRLLSSMTIGRQGPILGRTMAGMQGSLDTVSVAELCMQLGGQALSGTLTLTSSGREGQIAFQEGAIVWATSPSRGARIGDRLVHAGLLDPYYVAQAAQAQREAPPGTGIAALLVDRGLISADAARVFLQEQMIDALTDLLGWRDGTFELTTDAPPVVRLPVSVPTDSLLLEVRRRLSEQQRVRTLVTSLELVPAATGTRPDHLALDESVVLAEVDGQRSIGDVGTRLGFGDNELRRIVYGLTQLGAVSLNGGAHTQVPPETMDEVELAIEQSLDDALAVGLAPPAVDELESALEGLLAGDSGEAPFDAEGEVTPTDRESVAPPIDAGIDVPDEADETHEAGVSLIETERLAESDIDEPRPWVGYATAKPGTSPPRRRTPPPTDDLSYVAPSPTDDPVIEARRMPPSAPEPFTRAEAASWLADVSESETLDDAQDAAPESPAPDSATVPDEPPVDTPDEVLDDAVVDDAVGESSLPEGASRSRGGDDLSALLAELSSLSTDDDPGERPAAPPPRKPTSPADSDKDPRKRRRFGR